MGVKSTPGVDLSLVSTAVGSLGRYEEGGPTLSGTSLPPVRSPELKAKGALGTCTRVLEHGFAGGPREHVWGAQRGGHTTWKGPWQEWTVELAHDKGLLVVFFFYFRLESRGPRLGKKKEAHGEPFPSVLFFSWGC